MARAYPRPVQIALISAVLLSGCKLTDLIQNLGELKNLCHGARISELKEGNLSSLLDKCKASMQSLWPELRTNFIKTIIPFDVGLDSEGNLSLSMHGILDANLALNIHEMDRIKVYAKVDQSWIPVSQNDFSIQQIKGQVAKQFHVSVLSDFSSSLFDQNADSLQMIHESLLNSLPGEVLVEVNRIGSQIEQSSGEISELSDALRLMQNQIPTQMKPSVFLAQLNESINKLDSLNDSSQLLIVSTSGWSEQWTDEMKNSLRQTIAHSSTRLIFIGTGFADLDLMESSLKENDVLIYGYRYESLLPAVEDLSDSFDQMVEMKIDAQYQNASDIRLEIDGIQMNTSIR